MAAPPNPLQSAPVSSLPPSSTNAAANNAADTSALDKQRVTLILDINSHLLEQIQHLQAEGKGGDVQSPSSGDGSSATTMASSGGASPTQKKPSREYVEPLRRMQANLAYLASLAERHQKPNANHPPWPQVMTAPPGDEKLAAMYARLQGLFPMWRAHQQRMAAAAQAQQANHMGGGGGGQQNTMGAMPPQQQHMPGMPGMGGGGGGMGQSFGGGGMADNMG